MEDKGQVSRSAAEVYEEFFVPALFLRWTGLMAQAAQLAPGRAVLDVACGTGVLAREVAKRVAPGGSVTGLDRNEGMLAVARRVAPAIRWQQGLAESLPFPSAAFDAVVSQFGLMFFEDRIAALKEMWRVLRPGGRLAVAVWDGLDRTPGYAAMTALLQRLMGDEVADALRAPFRLGDPELLSSLVSESGIAGWKIRTVAGKAQFPSLSAWVHTDIKGWTLAEMIDEGQYQLLLREARRELEPYVQSDGRVEFDAAALLVTAVKL
jgi:SAM-dependent methyltransferase